MDLVYLKTVLVSRAVFLNCFITIMVVIKLSYAGEGGKITDLPETKKLRNSDDVDKVDEVLPF